MTKSQEWTLDGHGGKLVARTWPGQDPSHVVVLCHGYGEHAGRYEHVAQAMVDNGAVVHAVDHVGHGRSEGEPVLIHDFEAVVSDVHEVDVEARTQHPGLPVVLIGHSMGGLIAARYAQRYGDSLQALVLSGPVVGTTEWLLQLAALTEIPDTPIDLAALSRDVEVQKAYDADPLVWHGSFKRPTVQAFLEGVEAILQGPSLGSLPLFWLHGADDPLVPVAATRAGIEHLRGDTYLERIYPEGRHEMFNETNKDEVLADVARFIGDALSRTR